MIVTAAEYDYNSKDYNPGTVIIKDVAKTVVHICFLQRCFFGVLPPYINIICEEEKSATA